MSPGASPWVTADRRADGGLSGSVRRREGRRIANQPEQRRLDDQERPAGTAPADEAIQRAQAADERAHAAKARRESRAGDDQDPDERERLADLRERVADERERQADLREAAADERDRQWAADQTCVATHYYRMSGPQTIENAMRRLSQETHLSSTRVLGYANQHILRVDHPPGRMPDPIIHDIDPQARRLPEPPAGPN
jgi:hypothetical protein